MHMMKRKLMDTTYELIYKHGYLAASLKHILDMVNITRGSLYYHFSSKKVMALEAIVFHTEALLLEDEKIARDKEKSPKARLHKLLTSHLFKYESLDGILMVEDGFPLFNFILDMSNRDEQIGEYLKEAYERWTAIMEGLILEAKEIGEMKSDIDAADTAAFIMSAYSGCFTAGKACGDMLSLMRPFKMLEAYIDRL